MSSGTRDTREAAFKKAGLFTKDKIIAELKKDASDIRSLFENLANGHDLDANDIDLFVKCVQSYNAMLPDDKLALDKETAYTEEEHVGLGISESTTTTMKTAMDKGLKSDFFRKHSVGLVEKADETSVSELGLKPLSAEGLQRSMENKFTDIRKLMDKLFEGYSGLNESEKKLFAEFLVTYESMKEPEKTALGDVYINWGTRGSWYVKHLVDGYKKSDEFKEYAAKLVEEAGERKVDAAQKILDHEASLGPRATPTRSASHRGLATTTLASSDASRPRSASFSHRKGDDSRSTTTEELRAFSASMGGAPTATPVEAASAPADVVGGEGEGVGAPTAASPTPAAAAVAEVAAPTTTVAVEEAAAADTERRLSGNKVMEALARVMVSQKRAAERREAHATSTEIEAAAAAVAASASLKEDGVARGADESELPTVTSRRVMDALAAADDDALSVGSESSAVSAASGPIAPAVEGTAVVSGRGDPLRRTVSDRDLRAPSLAPARPRSASVGDKPVAEAAAPTTTTAALASTTSAIRQPLEIKRSSKRAAHTAAAAPTVAAAAVASKSEFELKKESASASLDKVMKSFPDYRRAAKSELDEMAAAVARKQPNVTKDDLIASINTDGARLSGSGAGTALQRAMMRLASGYRAEQYSEEEKLAFGKFIADLKQLQFNSEEVDVTSLSPTIANAEIKGETGVTGTVARAARLSRHSKLSDLLEGDKGRAAMLASTTTYEATEEGAKRKELAEEARKIDKERTLIESLEASLEEARTDLEAAADLGSLADAVDAAEEVISRSTIRAERLLDRRTNLEARDNALEGVSFMFDRAEAERKAAEAERIRLHDEKLVGKINRSLGRLGNSLKELAENPSSEVPAETLIPTIVRIGELKGSASRNAVLDRKILISEKKVGSILSKKTVRKEKTIREILRDAVSSGNEAFPKHDTKKLLHGLMSDGARARSEELAVELADFADHEIEIADAAVKSKEDMRAENVKAEEELAKLAAKGSDLTEAEKTRKTELEARVGFNERMLVMGGSSVSEAVDEYKAAKNSKDKAALKEKSDKVVLAFMASMPESILEDLKVFDNIDLVLEKETYDKLSVTMLEQEMTREKEEMSQAQGKSSKLVKKLMGLNKKLEELNENLKKNTVTQVKKAELEKEKKELEKEEKKLIKEIRILEENSKSESKLYLPSTEKIEKALFAIDTLKQQAKYFGLSEDMQHSIVVNAVGRAVIARDTAINVDHKASRNEEVENLSIDSAKARREVQETITAKANRKELIDFLANGLDEVVQKKIHNSMRREGVVRGVSEKVSRVAAEAINELMDERIPRDASPKERDQFRKAFFLLLPPESFKAGIANVLIRGIDGKGPNVKNRKTSRKEMFSLKDGVVLTRSSYGTDEGLKKAFKESIGEALNHNVKLSDMEPVVNDTVPMTSEEKKDLEFLKREARNVAKLHRESENTKITPEERIKALDKLMELISTRAKDREHRDALLERSVTFAGAQTLQSAFRRHKAQKAFVEAKEAADAGDKETLLKVTGRDNIDGIVKSVVSELKDKIIVYTSGGGKKSTEKTKGVVKGVSSSMRDLIEELRFEIEGDDELHIPTEAFIKGVSDVLVHGVGGEKPNFEAPTRIGIPNPEIASRNAYGGDDKKIKKAMLERVKYFTEHSGEKVEERTNLTARPQTTAEKTKAMTTDIRKLFSSGLRKKLSRKVHPAPQASGKPKRTR